MGASLTRSAQGVLAILLNQDVDGISPSDGAAALVDALVADGAPTAEATGLAAALTALGAEPNLQVLNAAINAYNALVTATDAVALPALVGELTPLRALFTNLIASASG
jgi:hypothetical protein